MSAYELKKEYEKEYLLFLTESCKKGKSSEALLKKFEEYHDLDKLGQDLENIKGFRGMGFFTLDRQIVTPILGTFLTYLIILMQWPSVDEESLPQYMNTVCCAAYEEFSTEFNFDLVETNATAKMVRIYFEICK